MSKSFKVSWIVVCQYAAEESDGRYTMSGVVPAEVTKARGSIDDFPTMYLVVSIMPLANSASVYIKITNGKKHIRTKTGFSSDASVIPDKMDRILFHFPFDPQKLGLGKYKVLMGDDEEKLSEEYSFLVGIEASDADEKSGVNVKN